MMCGALTIAEGGGCSYKKPEYLCRQTEVFLEEMEKNTRNRKQGYDDEYTKRAVTGTSVLYAGG